jgi:hypothetical protein
MSLIKSTIMVLLSTFMLLGHTSVAFSRFLQADPMSVREHAQRYQDRLRRPAASAWHVPLEINPYVAVANNPLKWTDPTGMVICAPDEYAIPNPPSPDCRGCTTGYTCVPRNPNGPPGNRCVTASCAASLPHSPTIDIRSALQAEIDSCEFVCGMMWLGPMIPMARTDLIPWIGGQVSSYFGCKWICKPDDCP